MSKKIQITVSDDMFTWLDSESKKRDTRASTLVSILLGERRKHQIDQANRQVLLESFKHI